MATSESQRNSPELREKVSLYLKDEREVLQRVDDHLLHAQVYLQEAMRVAEAGGLRFMREFGAGPRGETREDKLMIEIEKALGRIDSILNVPGPDVLEPDSIYVGNVCAFIPEGYEI